MKVFVSIIVVLLAILLAPILLPDPLPITDTNTLPTRVQSWHERGRYMDIGNHKLFYIYEKCRSKNIGSVPTFVILHGYPSSSYEYHKVIDLLLDHGHVFVHDHLGFGFSDKPAYNFTYSLGEAAENSLIAWRKMGLQNAHLVAHDMGDSVLTEILARYHRGLLPNYFEDFFKSVTFTNGGMKYSLINFRLGQILLSNVYLGPYFAKFANRLGIRQWFLNKQLHTIWGSEVNEEEMNRDIEAIEALYGFKGGDVITDKTIYYLWDRSHFEFRWFAALSELNMRIRLIWGDSDAVSPIAIPLFLKSIVPAAELSYLEGLGHFIMLEEPERWANRIVEVIK